MIGRRAFLKGLTAVGIFFLKACEQVTVQAMPCDSSADFVFSGVVELSEGFTVPTGETWELDPATDTTITVSSNIVVNGTLRATPNPGVNHTIRFTGINETDIVGGHAMAPVASDVGLWVDGGALDIAGTPKTPWNRTGNDPTWQPTDELRVTPMTPGVWLSQPFAIGNAVPTVSTPTIYDDTSHTYAAEVMNLTRNVTIEAVGGRAHIIIMNATKPQRLEYATLNNLGPTGKLGRYPLHVHHCGNGVDGSVFRGNVARSCGNHAYVTHLSNGCDHTGSIAYKCSGGDAFWWDNDDESERVRWDLCGAVECKGSGFRLGEGIGNSCIGSFAVGNDAATSNGGFLWPEAANGDRNVWAFDDCTAHNNRLDGFRVWQNDKGEHALLRCSSFFNAWAGFGHGAYNNRYRYFNCVAFGNDKGDFVAHALGRWTVRDCWIDKFRIVKHNAASADGPCRIEIGRGWPVFAIEVDEAGHGGDFEFISNYSKNDLTESDFDVVSQLSTISVDNHTQSDISLTPA